MNHLKLQSPMMHGSAVRRLQELGDLIGCDTGDNDGIFGKQTHEAVLLIQEKVGVKVDGVVGPVTWAALLEHVDTTARTDLDRPFVDIRGSHPPPKNYNGKRKWSSIRGVMMHQAGILMPENARNWGRCNCYMGFTQKGKTVVVNDATDFIWHGHGASPYTLGLEFSGNFCGVMGKRRTLWSGGGGPHKLTLDMKLASDDGFEFIKSEFEKNNQEWELILAHRQTSNMRRGDPGEEIWKNVAMVWAKRLGLKTYDGGQSYCLGKGRPIPKQWNPEYKDGY